MSAKHVSPLLDAAVEIQDFCEQRRWPFCFIGGIAVQQWGESRVTKYTDLTVFTGLGAEAGFIDALLAAFSSRIPEAREFALRNRVLLLFASNGKPIDVSLGALPFEHKVVSEAKLQELAPGFKLQLCSAVALVVFKVFAGRPRDWQDVEGIIAKSGKLIDWPSVRRDLNDHLTLKEDSESPPRLEKLLADYSR